MKQSLLALVLSLFCGASAVQAQGDWKPDPGFRSLFNGKDLTGWKYKGSKDDLAGKTETADKRFLVKDGAIVADVGKGIKDLYTIDEFDQDFVVKMEFRAGPKADSGVYIRGPQLQIRDFKRRGEQKHLTKFKDDDWNVLVITVKGTEATYTLNDEPLKPEKMKIPAKGGIGLQAETGKFEYRRIQIKTEGKDKADASTTPATSFTSAVGGTKKKLLLITESRGFVHSVVNRQGKPMCLVEKTFVDLAQKHPFFEVDFTQDSRSVINDENLKKYDAVFFYTTGELPLTDAQKSDLLAFVKKGKGFGGSHCATDTFYKWKEYGELIGGYFDGHPWHQKVKVVVENKTHPATKHLGDSFEITDEIYQFKAPYGRDKLKVLMRLEPEWVAAAREKELGAIESAKKALPEQLANLEKEGKVAEAKKLKAQVEGRKPAIRRTDNDCALAWIHEYGKGRVFYTALGHREDVWNDARFQQHIIGGLRYMFGLEQ